MILVSVFALAGALVVASAFSRNTALMVFAVAMMAGAMIAILASEAREFDQALTALKAMGH